MTDSGSHLSSSEELGVGDLPKPAHNGNNKVKSKKIYKEMYFFVTFFTFLNACISVKTGPINTKLGNFVNLGVLFLTMWINSC